MLNRFAALSVDEDASPRTTPQQVDGSELEASVDINAADALSCEFLICLDFEATCDEPPPGQKPLVSRDEQEIIEFPFVVYSVREKKVVFKKQTYIRPEFTPITSFCKKLTGITETVVSGGSTLQATVDDFVHYVESNFVKTGKTFNLVTHGHWDLVVQLRSECSRKGIQIPAWMLRFYDVREVYIWWLKTHSIPVDRPTSLVSICNQMKIQVQGRLHSGIDDCSTIAEILNVILRRYEKVSQDVPFPNPYQWDVQVENFKSEEGLCISISSIPYALYEDEFYAWVSALGIEREQVANAGRLGSMNSARAPASALIEFKTHKAALIAVLSNVVPLGSQAVFCKPLLATSNLSSYESLLFPMLSRPKSFQGRHVFLTNIPFHINQREINLFCTNIPKILPRSITKNIGDRGRFSGFCMLEYSSNKDAVLFLEHKQEALNRSLLGREICVYGIEDKEAKHLLTVGTWEECSLAREVQIEGLNETITQEKLTVTCNNYGVVQRAVHYLLPCAQNLILNPRVMSRKGRVVFKSVAMAELLCESEEFVPTINDSQSGDQEGTVTVTQALYVPLIPIKLFVGGLNPVTNENSLKYAFESYVEVLDCVVKRKPQSQESRRFGFITIDDRETGLQLCQSSLLVDGTLVQVREAAENN
eukprot:m.225356 g.225356  ORF g.225356 m.225356 type:complete len:649 (-) comp15956_c0_seq1:974-2920(-)